MTRKLLAQALQQTAHKLGYAFYSEFDHRMGETIIAYPTLWLSPPRIVAVEGRREGRIRYRITMHLMKLAQQARAAGDGLDFGGQVAGPDGAREQLWCALEAGAIEVCRGLADSRHVAAATLMDCAPAEFSLTNHGEVSICLKMDVDMNFCNI
ncbi:MAG: hypothetical protein LBU95_03535 [Rikenellaceae bacterium]|jgi:hypothetical protein|nr:hypothetical protein [Rikenellaceae bacterium]